MKCGTGFASPRVSSPPTAATTPGISRARLVSTLLMRAWACGLRSTAACSMPGSSMSATYRAFPWPKRSPLSFFWREPTYLRRGASCGARSTSMVMRFLLS